MRGERVKYIRWALYGGAVLCVLLFCMSSVQLLSSIERGSFLLPVAFLYIVVALLLVGFAEILNQVDLLRQEHAQFVRLESVPVDERVPDAIELMAKRVQATIAKKSSKPTSIASLKKTIDVYMCEVQVGADLHRFSIPLTQGEDSNAWLGAAQRILQQV